MFRKWIEVGVQHSRRFSRVFGLGGFLGKLTTYHASTCSQEARNARDTPLQSRPGSASRVWPRFLPSRRRLARYGRAMAKMCTWKSSNQRWMILQTTSDFNHLIGALMSPCVSDSLCGFPTSNYHILTEDPPPARFHRTFMVFPARFIGFAKHLESSES